MSFNHWSSTGTVMSSPLKISVYVVLVFATTALASGRTNWVDLGTSVSIPWESSNNRGVGNKIYSSVPGPQILAVGNVDNLNLNGRNVLQQRQGDLVRLNNEYNRRKLNQAQGAANLDPIQDSLEQYSNDRYGRSGLQEGNGYSSLGGLSRFNSNPLIGQQLALIGKVGQRQSQYQLNQQNLDGGAAQLNLEGLRSGVLKSSVNGGINSQASINSNEFNGKLSGLGLGLSEENIQGLRNSGVSLSGNNFGQNIGQAYGSLNGQNLWRNNQESLQGGNAQQNIQRNYGGYGGRGSFYQSLRSLDNQQLNRPVAQDVLSGVYNRQYPSNDAWTPERQSAQLQVDNQNLGANNEQLGSQLQNQDNVNQQQGNSYTYGELSARIWNVIKSNPAMISNLDNLREQLLNGNNSGNEQVGQLRALLQDARNKNILIPRNVVGQSAEEQQRNAIVNNLIDAMSKNGRGQISYGGW
ncbi:putative uncharacterized protein DDB_G0286901 [Harmonia axyridis]|uniref:putative uncharacterized protein DDB_G0286901 n=1 Tax=Harmonia axyridis TaxID=115357 RepID=UPI001E275AE0|nr:putative uncharacterized protein DDB_G0286901 [Harmonia axyridis]